MSLIKPEIYKGIVGAKFKEKVKILNLAIDLGEIDDFKSVGETIHFPKFKTIGNCVEMVKGDTLTTEELAQEDSTATIKMIGKAVRVYDIENLTAMGNQVDESARQQAIVFARKLDTDLVTEALTSPLKSATVGGSVITAQEINTGMRLFADEIDTDEFAGIVINSRLVDSFIAMPEFTDATKTYNASGNGVVSSGVIGYFRGIAVYVADHGTYDAVKNECVSFVVKKNALGYKMKRDINIELERMAKSKATDVVGDMIYAVKLVNDEGVVVLRKTIA